MLEEGRLDDEINRAATFEVRDDYDDSLLLNFYLTSNSEGFWTGIEKLHDNLGMSRHSREARTKTLGFVFLNLFYLFTSGRAEWIAFSRSTNFYTGSGRYNPQGISARQIRSVVDALIKIGYIEFIRGVNFVDFKRISRMRATPLLIELFMSSSDIFNDDLLLNTLQPELIILKDNKKKKKEYPESDFTRNSRELLDRYNAMLKKNLIDIDLKGFNWKRLYPKKIKQPKYIKFDVLNKLTYRVFNNSSFEYGGRFYGGWFQNIPSSLRSRIVINNKPTVEYDFRAIHVVLLYALNGIDYFSKYGEDVDPYLDAESVRAFEVTGKNREIYRSLFKTTFMCCINSDSKEKAKKALANSVRKDTALSKLKLDILLDLVHAYRRLI